MSNLGDILAPYILNQEAERDPMHQIEMQSALRTLMVVIGIVGESEKVRGIDLPGIAMDWVRKNHPEHIYEGD